MKAGATNSQVGPPPVNVAVMVPVPVAEPALYDTITGVTLFDGAEGALVPAAFVAVTVNV